mgnify:CR=1 FL=1
MKKYLTEKNLMWIAIAAVAVLALASCSSECCGMETARKGMKNQNPKMEQRMKRMQSMGDRGRGAWVKEAKEGKKGKRQRPEKPAK